MVWGGRRLIENPDLWHKYCLHPWQSAGVTQAKDIPQNPSSFASRRLLHDNFAIWNFLDNLRF
jgi:hypothetical protein